MKTASTLAFWVATLWTTNSINALYNNQIRAISLDVTGTLVAARDPVIQSYHEAAVWAQLENPPSAEELKAAFKVAYKERCIESPCFGGVEGISGRDWWRSTVQRVIQHTGRTYSERDFERYFRRVYQHFGSPRGYMVLEDAAQLLGKVEDDIVLGITSNTPMRHMESVLPMLDIDNKFQWFTCSQDVGTEKPEPAIFEASFDQAKFWLPDLEPSQILHIGDSLACDYCGAKAYGMEALLLDRSDNPNVVAYQDWINAPDYPNKSQEDIEQHTITNLNQVLEFLNRRDKSGPS
jgi:putative hydrolase of the HAD superfamily